MEKSLKHQEAFGDVSGSEVRVEKLEFVNKLLINVHVDGVLNSAYEVGPGTLNLPGSGAGSGINRLLGPPTNYLLETAARIIAQASLQATKTDSLKPVVVSTSSRFWDEKDSSVFRQKLDAVIQLIENLQK